MKLKQEDLQKLIQLYQKYYNLDGEMELEEVSSLLGLSDKETVYTLFKLFLILNNTVWNQKEEIEKLKERNRVVEAALDDITQNGNQKQTALVKNGNKIRKSKMTLLDLKLVMKLDYTDQEIMDYFEISKSTLWRRKKELEEEERNKKKDKGTYQRYRR